MSSVLYRMWLAEDEGSSACVDHGHSTMIVVGLSWVAERNYVYYILERDSAVSGCGMTILHMVPGARSCLLATLTSLSRRKIGEASGNDDDV